MNIINSTYAKPRIFQGSCRTSDKAVLSDRDVAVATSKEEKLVNPGLVKSEDARILRKSSKALINRGNISILIDEALVNNIIHKAN